VRLKNKDTEKTAKGEGEIKNGEEETRIGKEKQRIVKK
jgi:hypothetical protein